jgi:hypothetical protein
VRKWPTLVQGVVLAICGAVLLIGGCLGYLTYSGNLMGMLGGGAFFAGLAILLVGIAFCLVGLIKGIAWLFKTGQ